LNVLIYGAPGVGKTTMACKSPKPLLVDFEAGSLSVRNVKGLRVESPRSLEDIVDVFDNIDPKKTETVVLDSVTELQRLMMLEIMESATRRDPRKSLFSPTLSEWGVNSEVMRFLIRKARDLPCHSIFVCLDSDAKDEPTGKITKVPAITPKVREDLCSYVDIIGWYNMKKEAREVNFAPSESYIAKDRSGVMPDVLRGKDVSIDHIIKLLKEV
jgi:hypothetical protein